MFSIAPDYSYCIAYALPPSIGSDGWQAGRKNRANLKGRTSVDWQGNWKYRRTWSGNEKSAAQAHHPPFRIDHRFQCYFLSTGSCADAGYRFLLSSPFLESCAFCGTFSSLKLVFKHFYKLSRTPASHFTACHSSLRGEFEKEKGIICQIAHVGERLFRIFKFLPAHVSCNIHPYMDDVPLPFEMLH